MNKVGIYFAFWTREWEADYKYYIKKAARLGFDILEITTANLIGVPAGRRREIRSAADDAGIGLTYCIGTPPEYDLASPDKKVRENGMEYSKRTLEAIHDMGGKIFGGINYSCWPVVQAPAGLEEKRAYRDRSVECMRKIIKAAEDFDITYCFEVVNRFEQFLLNTAAEGAEYCKAVESPNAKLLLDSFHMNIEEDSFTNAIVTAGDRLGHFHIGEPNRKTPGTGRMPWHEIYSALNSISYSGAVVMEPFVTPGGTVGKNIRVWRDLSDGGADEARLDEKALHACAFTKAVLDSTFENGGRGLLQ